MIDNKFKILEKYIEYTDIPIIYIPKFREYGIKVLDGGTSYIEIKFCPFTGQKLPNSLRKIWFEKIEKLNLEPDANNIPEKLKTDEWWLEKKL